MLSGCVLATPANAHGFGERYELPLPLSLYLYGTVAIVLLTFLLVGYFARGAALAANRRHFDVLALPAGKVIAHPAVISLLKLASVAIFLVTVAAGFFGSQNPYRNIAPTLVWIIVWIGLAYVSAFVGNVWALINPWRTLHEWGDAVYLRIAGHRARPPRWPYPEALGVWPATVFLLAFSWFELVYPTPAVPAQIACIAVGYSILTWLGMTAFGRDAWLRHGEVFSVVFATYARFAPTEAHAAPQPRLLVRPFGAGLSDRQRASPSTTAFVLLLLSSVLVDGLLNTPEWAYLEEAIAGAIDPITIRTAGLLLFWLVFIGAYAGVTALMAAAASAGRSTSEIGARFVLTLIPIAIGYHVAHYLTFLLIQGQYIIPLVSDPFGRGWDLFGTAGYRVDIGVVSARFAWYAAVAAIVVGHVVAVYLAHRIAMRELRPRRAAFRSQVPLTALMMVYTFVSLSILAEPLVERPRPAQPSDVAAAVVRVPPDALLPEAGGGRLQPVGPDRSAQVKLTYRVLGSAFHDGTRMSIADVLYAYAFAYRWGARRDDGATEYDPYVDAATASMRARIVGLRAAGSDAVSRSFRIGDVNFVRELFTFEVYANATPQDPEREAAVAPPWSTLPWHLVALMEEAVARGWAAFSQSEAARRGVEWLDLARSEQTNARLLSLVETFARDGYRPPALRSLVNAEEARRRWTALAAFFKERGHFLVTNGPYQLKRWSAEGAALEAFRDLTYPLGVGSYDAYANPRRGYITAVEIGKGGRIRLQGDIETVVKFARSQRIERAPIQSVPREVLKRAAPECRYVVFDDAGRAVLAGTIPLGEDLSFQVDAGATLTAGRYTFAALIAVNENLMNAEIRHIPLEISADR